MSLVDKLADLQVDAVDLDRLRTAEAALAKNAADKVAIRSKLVALIRLDKYNAAAAVLKKLGASASEYPDEAAYVWYRTKQLAALRELAQTTGKSREAVALALSQAEYKAGNFGAALELLQNVRVPETERYDVGVNISAVNAGAGAGLASNDTTAGFDHSFNRAYGLIVAGKYNDALAELSRAKQEARDDEESQSAVVQAAYVQALSGNSGIAQALLGTIDQSELDAGLKAVILNNTVALSPPTEADAIQESLKNYDGALDGLIDAQARGFQANKIIVQGQSGRKIGHLAETYQREFPGYLTPSVAAVIRNTDGDERALRKLVAQNPTSVAASLALAQSVAGSDDDAKAATVVLELVSALKSSGKDSELSAGLVGAAVAAYKTAHGSSEDRIAELLRSVDFDGDFAVPAVLLALYGSGDDTAKSAKFFESLHQDAVVSLAGKLVAAPKSASYAEFTDTAPSVAELTDAVDVAHLESIGILPLIKRRARPSFQPKHKKRSGKRRLPKEYDESKTPDPERWLAKQDRSNYKPKRKKGGQATQGATQGAAATPPPAPSAASAGINKAKAKKKKGKKK